MKSDNAIRNGTSIFVGIIVAIAAFVRGALLLPLLLVACSVWGLYVLHHLRGSLPAVPEKKAKAPRRTKFVVPDIEDEPLSDILLLHVNQRVTAALRTAGSNITWEWATKDPLSLKGFPFRTYSVTTKRSLKLNCCIAAICCWSVPARI